MFKLAVFNIEHLISSREDFFAFFFLCVKLQEISIKIQYAHISKSYLKFRHVPELSQSVHRGINPLPKHPPPYFLPSLLQIVEAPLFRQFPIYILWSPSPKNWWTPIILKLFIFNPIYVLKATKLLVKICWFKFLVLADKHFGL